MKTNINKRSLKEKLEDLLEHIQDVGFAIGNPELNYMTDEFRDEYAEIERSLDGLIEKVDSLTI